MLFQVVTLCLKIIAMSTKMIKIIGNISSTPDFNQNITTKTFHYKGVGSMLLMHMTRKKMSSFKFQTINPNSK